MDHSVWKQTLQAVADHQKGADGKGQWKVLIVDYDQASLLALEETLHSCNFLVTKCESGKEALSTFQEEGNRFDLVITERHLMDMDGLDLIQYISVLDPGFPVIVMSTEDKDEAIKDAIRGGACEYLVKPIQVQNARHLWKHAYFPRKKNTSRVAGEQSGSCNEKGASDSEHTSGTHGGCSKCLKRRESKELGGALNGDDAAAPARKKQRVIWTPDLHDKFVAAVDQLGITKAVPKKILEIMNVPGLTRENVASHLQKYRQYHKRYEESKQHHNELRAAALMRHQEHVNKVSSPIGGHNFPAQATLLGPPMVQAPSMIQEKGEYGRLAPNCDNSSMLEFEMRQQAMINCRSLVISNQPQDQVNRTYESQAIAPPYHQPHLEQSITKHGSRFWGLPTTSPGTVSIANASGAYYNMHESQVQTHTFDDFATNNDLSAAYAFGSSKGMAVTDVVECERYEQHGHDTIVENGNDNKMYYPLPMAYPVMDSGVQVVELPLNGLTTERSFMDMEMRTVDGQGNYQSLGNFNGRIPNNTFKHAFDSGFDHHVAESLNQNDLMMEPFEQQGAGYQQEANLQEGSSFEKHFS